MVKNEADISLQWLGVQHRWRFSLSQLITITITIIITSMQDKQKKTINFFYCLLENYLFIKFIKTRKLKGHECPLELERVLV